MHRCARLASQGVLQQVAWHVGSWLTQCGASHLKMQEEACLRETQKQTLGFCLLKPGCMPATVPLPPSESPKRLFHQASW